MIIYNASYCIIQIYGQIHEINRVCGALKFCIKSIRTMSVSVSVLQPSIEPFPKQSFDFISIDFWLQNKLNGHIHHHNYIVFSVESEAAKFIRISSFLYLMKIFHLHLQCVHSPVDSVGIEFVDFKSTSAGCFGNR